MTVHIHPKDSGPIDTADRDKCDSCGRTVRRRGDKVYRDVSPTRRKTRPWHTTYLRTCPYFRGAVDSPTADTIHHRDCDTLFPAFRAINGHRIDRNTLCPGCEEPLDE